MCILYLLYCIHIILYFKKVCLYILFCPSIHPQSCTIPTDIGQETVDTLDWRDTKALTLHSHSHTPTENCVYI